MITHADVPDNSLFYRDRVSVIAPVGESEDHVGICNGQDLFCPFGEPLVAIPAVALWAMSVATGSVFDYLMRAVVALLNVCAQRGCTAGRDISERLPLS